MTTTAISDDLAEILPGYYVDPWRGTGAWCTLPWPLDDAAKVELITNSIGPQIIDWAEWRTYEETGEPGLVHHLTGERWRFTPGQKRFMILWWAYNPVTGRYRFRSGVKRGAKGTGKDPFGAAWCNANLIGPSQLVQRNGLWVGERYRMPLVQVASNSEAQSKDVLRVANGQLCRETRDHYGLDCGETRTIISGGGRLEILTASEKTSEGDPATAIMVNESHHGTEASGGHRMAEVVRRNVAKSPREMQARECQFTNAHMMGYDSVAERAYEAWQLQVSGQAKRIDILYDSIEAPPWVDLTDDASRMAGLKAAYMDAPWSDLERLSDEILDARTSIADSIRFYMNGLGIAQDAWVDPGKFDLCARPDVVINDGDMIAMFLDCSKSGDATALVACRIDDGHVFTLGVWQRPKGWDEKRRGLWLAPRAEVDAVVQATFKRYHVVWFGVDPSPAKDDETESLYWMPQIDTWHRKYRDKLPIWATPGEKIGHSVLFDMRLSQRGGVERNKAFTEMAMQTVVDIEGTEGIPGTLTWDGDPILRTHTHNARRRPNQWGVSLGKANRDSKKLVDYAVCMVGGRLGRRIALNSGKLPKKRSGRVVSWR